MIKLALYSEDQKLRPLIAPALGSGFEVVIQPTWDRTRDLLARGVIDVLLLDIDSNFADSQSLIQQYEEISDLGVAVVILTDDLSRPLAVDLVQRGAHSYCRKPPAMRELKSMLRRAYEYTAMKRQLDDKHARAFQLDEQERSAPSCDGLIGGSPAMRSMYEMIGKVANLNASVLITGESGTGKELIARAIHNLGDRTADPFVAVSCGAIPETLIESELFGHEKGAFTGSAGVRIGLLEQAGAGTLFLDEIGELSLQTQVKLLRVLQQREYTRLGGNRPIPLRARILFATHRNLQQMIAAGTFRLDLYYRINVVSINAPSLADHPEDIPCLANHFLRLYAGSYRKSVTRISPCALSLLERYDWPGNIRELENVIQSALIQSNTDGIDVEDLPARLQDEEDSNEVLSEPSGSFENLLREYKIKIATKAIEDCSGNKTLAARSLGISRAYLHRLVRLPDVTSIDRRAAS